MPVCKPSKQSTWHYCCNPHCSLYLSTDADKLLSGQRRHLWMGIKTKSTTKVPQKYIKVHKSTKNLCVWNLIILLKHWKKMRTSLKQSYGKAPVTDLDPRIFLCLLHLYVVDLHLWKTVLSWLIYANLWWIYQVSSKFVPKLIVLIITALYILELTRSPCQNEVALKITVTYHLPEYLWLNLNSYRPDVTTIKAF